MHPSRLAVARLSGLLLLAALVGCFEITAVTPNPGLAGGPIEIHGSDFGTEQGNGWVTYDGQPLTITEWTDTVIRGTVPSPKASGEYTMEVFKGSSLATVTHELKEPVPPIDMIFVPAGEFIMGSEGFAENQRPEHVVYLDDYYFDRLPTTVVQYETCHADGGCTRPTIGGSCNWDVPGRENYPINCIDWYQAVEYCEWAGKRLLTEAEWEKAARGTDGRTYPWGESPVPNCDYAIMHDPAVGGIGCGQLSTGPVGSKPLGVSPYGGLDMSGQVWEWVQDWYHPEYYSESPYANPPGPDSSPFNTRVLKGGAWNLNADLFHGLMRSAARYFVIPEDTGALKGIRCAKDG